MFEIFPAAIQSRIHRKKMLIISKLQNITNILLSMDRYTNLINVSSLTLEVEHITM